MFGGLERLGLCSSTDLQVESQRAVAKDFALVAACPHLTSSGADTTTACLPLGPHTLKMPLSVSDSYERDWHQAAKRTTCDVLCPGGCSWLRTRTFACTLRAPRARPSSGSAGCCPAKRWARDLCTHTLVSELVCYDALHPSQLTHLASCVRATQLAAGTRRRALPVHVKAQPQAHGLFAQWRRPSRTAMARPAYTSHISVVQWPELLHDTPLLCHRWAQSSLPDRAMG